MAQATVLVASPSAIGRMPVASGSSVPPCPAFAAPVMRRTAPTAWLELSPSGLSRTIQPWMGVPRRLRAIVLALCSVFVGHPLFVVRRRLILGDEVTFDFRTMKQRLDAACMVEGGVEREAQAGNVTQLQLT